MSIFDKIFDFLRRDDIGAKLVCVFMAVGLWYYVMTEQNPISERLVEVDLHRINQKQEHYIEGVPNKVLVTVRGPRINLNSNLESKINATVDFKNANVGQQSFPVIVKSQTGTVLNYSPRDISVYVDTFSEKKVPVTTRSVGKANDDLALGKCTIQPNEAVVRGATRRIQNINKVVAPVSVTGQSEAFQTDCELVAVNDYGADVPNMRIIPARVNVYAQLVSQMHSMEVPVVANISGDLPDGVRVSKIEVVPNHVRVTAPPSIANALKELKTQPINVSNLAGSQEIACELEMPEKVLPETRTVKVRISVEPIAAVKKDHEKHKKNETKN